MKLSQLFLQDLRSHALLFERSVSEVENFSTRVRQPADRARRIKVRKSWFLLLLIGIFLVSRLWKLNSGLNLLEPDEWDYQNISQSFAKSAMPTWKGLPYLEKFPLFVFLGFLVERLIKATTWLGPYGNLRLISVISNGLVALLMFFWLKRRVRFALTLGTTFLFILTPVVLFYSRVGTLDSFASFFAVLSFYFFANSLENLSLKKAIWLASLITLAILAKQVNLILLALPVSLLFYEWVSKRRISWKQILIIFFVFLFLGSILGLIGLLQKQTSPTAIVSLGEKFLVISPIQAFTQLVVYVQKSNYWLGLPILIWLSLGMFLAVTKRYREKIIWLMAGVILTWIVLLAFYGRVTPRNLLAGIPFLLMLASLGYDQYLIKKTGKIVFLGFSIIILLLIPKSYEAWKSGNHDGVEKAVSEVKKIIKQNPQLPVFATFDQEKISELIGQPVFFLTPEATQAGIILTDIRKTELMLNLTEPEFTEAKAVLRLIEKDSQPVWQLVDNQPYFPGTNLGNQFKIYVFEK